ncbi:MAG: hypothetical protein JRH20_27640 [Deltaproteobacteria bacterium]|nr:hypothetical protein [Deltaproteobacteria bacterium]
MKKLAPPAESQSSLALVESVFSATELGGYTELKLQLPLYIHDATGIPDLSAEAIHVFPDGFDDESVDVNDPDQGNETFTIFAGDVRCRSLYTGTWMGVGGKLTTSVLHGNSGSNRVFVAAEIAATLILEEGHSFEFEKIQAGTVYSEHGLIEDPDDGSIECFSDDASELFAPEFMKPLEGYEDEYEVLYDKITQALIDGKPWKHKG